ncbi:MAG: hypothetical protein ACE5ID_09345, partial [Acidobacteriota bacterium]
TQREDLEQATQRLQTRSGDSLDSLAAFQAVRARAPDSDLLLFVNFKEIFSGLQKALREMEAASGENEAAEALVSPDLDDRFHLLGLDAMEAAFLSLHLEAHAVRFDYGLLQAENRGLFRLMAFQPVPAVLPPFMPARSTSASMTGFDFGQAWEAINDILYSLEPDLAVLMQSQVKAFESMTDIRLKADLLDELGPLVYTMTLPSEAQEATKTSPGTGTILSGDSSESSRSNSTRSAPPSTRDNQKELPATVFLVQVHDRAAMEKTLAALLTPLGPLEDLFKTEDVEGVALHTANHFFQDTDSMPPSISYAVADHWVMVGAAPGTVMQKILRECLHPDRPLSSRSDLSKALAALPPGAVSITYQDFGIFAQRLKSTLTLLQKNGPTASQQTRTFLPALHSALLQGSFRISVSTMQRTGEGLFGTTRWLNP